MTREELPVRLRGMAEMLDGSQNEGNLVLPAILRGMRDAADEIESLKSQLAQITAERDAAVEDLKISGDCDTCKHPLTNGGRCWGGCRGLVGSNYSYEWRGPQREDQHGM